MSDNKRLKNYDDLPLVLDVADIRRIMGISRVSAYELVHTPGFPAFRSGRLIKVSKKAFFDWMEKGTEEEYKYAMTEDEMLYLTIHIQKITEDHKRLKNL